jgi:hypothetical protein
MVGYGASARPDVELVAFHDAVVERVEVTNAGNVHITFSHLPVYRRETPDTCGVWSFRAELRLKGVESFEAAGVPPADDAESIEDIHVVGPDGARLPAGVLERGEMFALGSVEIIWALSGTRATFCGGQLWLRLLEPIERVETWTGPLFDE